MITKSNLFVLVLISGITCGPGAQADWCSGNSWWLFNMPISQRITDANAAITAELKQVAHDLQVINDDIGKHHAQLATALDHDQQSLIHQAQTQCKVATANPTGQVALRTQLRLDIGTLAAMQEVGRQLTKQMQEYQTLSQDIEAHRYELQSLQQRLAQMIDVTPNKIEADLTLRSACTSVQNSIALRGHYHPISREIIDQQILQTQDLLTEIPESTIAQVMETCSFAQVQIPSIP